jgi:anti-sigma B factor antagonist
MKFIRSENAGELVLRIEGELDALTVSDVRPEIDAVVASKPRKVTLDLSALRLIDSSGVGAIVSLFKRVKAGGGDVKVAGLKNQPLAIFKLLRLDRVLGG